MSDLFGRVIHHLEGEERFIQEWQTAKGIKSIEAKSYGPDRWIERVHERGILSGLDCISLIAFALHEWPVEKRQLIVDAWATEVRKAAIEGEIQARDPLTFLALSALPDGWNWALSMSDADKFIAAREMTWTCSEIAAHLYRETQGSRDRLRCPPELFNSDAASVRTTAPKQADAADDWKAQARKIADVIFERDTKQGCRDTLANYSKRVMEEMQKQGIKGPRGIITNPNTVQRDALQGRLWWSKKAK